MVSTAINVEAVTKAYGELRAVDGIDLEVAEGEIFGIIGPNGAGKTTLVECMEGLRTPDSGTVEVLGLNPEHDARAIRRRTGVQLQSAALPSHITISEALRLFASFYADPADWRTLMSRLGLQDKRDTLIENLSGGQRQRVFVALALINSPELVFLDELTTGLDPQSRLAIWELVEDIRGAGTTVLLTTHLMEEAERLCDRVAIVDHGRVVALGTLDELLASIDAESRLSFRLDGTPPVDRLRSVSGVVRVENEGDRVVVHGNGARFPQGVMEVLADLDLRMRDLRSDQPDLEDVFLALTGREMRVGKDLP